MINNPTRRFKQAPDRPHSRGSKSSNTRARTRTRGPFLGFLLATTVVVASNGLAATVASASPLTSHVQVPAPLYAVGSTRCTFVDSTRGVLNYRVKPYRVLATHRTLVTEIRYPTALSASSSGESSANVPLARSGGYPVVIFAHGYNVTPDIYQPLLDAWVQAGFVVVAPFFPDENALAVAQQGGANTEADVVNEPGDLAFVTTSIIQASAGVSSTCSLLSGLIDPNELALAGHSDGAEAVGMLAYDHGVDPQGVNYADLRKGINYRAIIILSGAPDTYQSYASEASEPNMLMIHSLADACNPLHNGVQLYNEIHQTNKWFLELTTAHHLPPFDGTDRAAFQLVATTTINFLQSSLEGTVTPAYVTMTGGSAPSLGRMFAGVHGPSLKNVPKVEEHCGLN